MAYWFLAPSETVPNAGTAVFIEDGSGSKHAVPEGEPCFS